MNFFLCLNCCIAILPVVKLFLWGKSFSTYITGLGTISAITSGDDLHNFGSETSYWEDVIVCPGKLYGLQLGAPDMTLVNVMFNRPYYTRLFKYDRD